MKHQRLFLFLTSLLLLASTLPQSQAQVAVQSGTGVGPNLTIGLVKTPPACPSAVSASSTLPKDSNGNYQLAPGASGQFIVTLSGPVPTGATCSLVSTSADISKFTVTSPMPIPVGASAVQFTATATTTFP